MAQNKHDRPTAAQLAMGGIGIFDANVRARLLQRHRREFQSGKKICAQSLKMATHEVPHLLRRFFPAECDLAATKSQPPIFPEHKPDTEAESVPKRKGDAKAQ